MPWPARIAYAFLWLVARVPVRALHACGGIAGAWFWVRRGRKRRIVEANLARVRPDLEAVARRRLARACVHEAGITLADALTVWTNPRRTLARVAEVRGRRLFEAALAERRGLILCAPHLGSWEAAMPWISARTRFATLFTAPRRPALAALLQRLRGDSLQFPADATGVRRLLRHLRDGGVVSILPDHVPRAGGIVAPFFGVPALTAPLLPRLAARSGAAVLLLFVERLDGSARYRVHLRQPPSALFATDLHEACTALNAAVEACVHDAFAQYQWTYKRFKPRPGSGLADDAYAAAGVPS